MDRGSVIQMSFAMNSQQSQGQFGLFCRPLGDFYDFAGWIGGSVLVNGERIGATAGNIAYVFA